MPKASSSSPSPGQQLIDSCKKSANIAAVQKLLDEGVDVNWKDTLGDTALICASVHGHVEIIKLLLDKGALPDIQNNFGGTALMNASHNGRVDCARLLLERGADMFITTTTKSSKTAKDYVKKNTRHGKELVHLFNEVRIFNFKEKDSNIVICI
jgi:ankyrin repeat protein